MESSNINLGPTPPTPPIQLTSQTTGHTGTISRGLTSTETAREQLTDVKNIDWKTKSCQVLSFLAGGALGVLTGMAAAGILASPVGWAIGGGALFIGLLGSLAFGGKDEFIDALTLSLGGFSVGFGASFAVLPMATTGITFMRFLFYGGLSSMAMLQGGALIAKATDLDS